MNGIITLEGKWEGSFGERWRLEGKLQFVDGKVIVEGSGFKWRLMVCPDVPALQRWRNRIGQWGYEFLSGVIAENTLRLKTQNVDDQTFLSFSEYSILLDFKSMTFAGSSESVTGTDSPYIGHLKGEFQMDTANPGQV